MTTVFLLAGKTGGPLIPLLAIQKKIAADAIIIGVKKGVETKIAADRGLAIEYVPEAKFALGSFSHTSWQEKLAGVGSLLLTLFALFFSWCRCLYLLGKYRPDIVLGAGSFVTIPMVLALKITNMLRITHTRFVLHQQDPVPGLANAFSVRFAGIKTCVFEKTKEYQGFADATRIPNPLDTEVFDQQVLARTFRDAATSKPRLYEFLSAHRTKPLLFIVGGGGGSRVINHWVQSNREAVCERFLVLHVTGALQPDEALPEHNGYLSVPFLYAEYGLCLVASDVVLCRAGIGTLSELQYLGKKAVLVPIADSHQEDNAAQVASLFSIVSQTAPETWLETLVKTERNPAPAAVDAGYYEEQLAAYYDSIQKLYHKSEENQA
jgi:UDP-N-acetylglucosamine--N-acetylmuramyl-(pentapeptide) pyrophosphoryl-undecaprenol N-acetylglucosamine transferase